VLCYNWKKELDIGGEFKMQKKLAKVIPLFKEPPIQIEKMNGEELEEFFRGLNFNVAYEPDGNETLMEFVENCVGYAFTNVVDDIPIVSLPVEDMDTLMEGVAEASDILKRYQTALQEIANMDESKADAIQIAKKALELNK